MKKGKAEKGKAGRRRAKKSSVAPKNVAEYLTGIPDSSRATFTKLRAAIRASVPKDAIETISYGIPAIRRHRILVWYAAFSKHCSLFPTASVIARFRDDLKEYSLSKGTIHFPIDKPLPTALIKRMVRARVADEQN